MVEMDNKPGNIHEHSQLGEFSIREGIIDTQIDQLIHYSNTDPLIADPGRTSDSKRFKDRESFEKWRQKGRTVYTLTDNKGDLHGIIWFGKEQLTVDPELANPGFDPEQYGNTFAIRLFQGARGKGNAKQFMQDAFDRYTTRSEVQASANSAVWLEVSDDNIAAKKLYTRFGFQPVTKPDKEGKIKMVL